MCLPFATTLAADTCSTDNNRSSLPRGKIPGEKATRNVTVSPHGDHLSSEPASSRIARGTPAVSKHGGAKRRDLAILIRTLQVPRLPSTLECTFIRAILANNKKGGDISRFEIMNYLSHLAKA
ncbi:hypothetical protein I7I50_04734 [Histoplasma capsulatum G186AR]|uniref:Uncharacterized protein n=1 Tax=Ajellomyces capsulatus TaxID=5037 RepID=A0A8H8CY68_AJECA|nr:hypothetical protein I7I52_05643 [Histoplasma capsulatum]QSS75562.1 hypothetical protein I7I50_04734 [Histoplasma capsulatum G186AR]